MWQLSAGVLMGWSLGSNDAANVFGTAVASRMIRFTLAAVICSVFVIVGAMLEGQEGIETYRGMSAMSLGKAFTVSLAAALAVTLMTILRLPVSTSQAVVGGLVFFGWKQHDLQLGLLTKVVLCWVGTPLGSLVISIILYYGIGKLMNRLNPNLFEYDRLLRWGLILAGTYGAYALGANNVANVTGPFVGEKMLTPLSACFIGGASIALGVLTFSRNVMYTVGKSIVKLSAFAAFIVVLSEAITVHIYAIVGVPVSTSQAVVGAVFGMGLIKGMKTINYGRLGMVLSGWLSTPLLAFSLTWVLFATLSHFWPHLYS